MQKTGSFVSTGVTIQGPGADLVELSAQDGRVYTAVVFHPLYREHPALELPSGGLRSFLEVPLVDGLAELVHQDRAQGAFVYQTGKSWALGELSAVLAQRSESGSPRAALELLYGAALTLVEAAESGATAGVLSHGGLNPWRLLLDERAQTLIIGAGLPPVELLTFHEDPKLLPAADTFRYCPPERLMGGREGLSSDLYALALIAFELMTGRPVFDGLVQEIRQQAARGEGSRRLFAFREQVPEGIRQLLSRALRRHPEERHVSGLSFLEETQRLLCGPEAKGPSLQELLARLRPALRRQPVWSDVAVTESVRTEPGARGRALSGPRRPRSADAPPPAMLNPPPPGPDPTLERTYSVELGDRTITARWRGDVLCAEAAAALIGSAVPIPLEVSGQLRGWYRLEQRGRALPGGARLLDVDPAAPLRLRFVPNQGAFADIDIDSFAWRRGRRVQVPVGLAVPVSSLVAALVDALGLPSAAWRLTHGGRALHPSAILADEVLGSPITLRLEVRKEEAQPQASIRRT